MLKSVRTLFLCLCAVVVLGSRNLSAQVVINEILADNEAATSATGLFDEDKERSDWIEIYNAGATDVDLTDWSLSDDPAFLAKWKFPATNIVANGFVIVFASGKDRAIAGRQLHTNFKLGSGGEYLALVKPDGKTITFQFTPEYPQQNPNVSYGLTGGSLTDLRYFATPTPNAPNSSGQSDFSEEPIFSLPSGPYVSSVTVALSSPQTDAVIRYTLNGTDPTTASSPYSAPLTFSTTAVVRAKCFVPGLVPSTTVTRTFTIMDSSLANFSSPLPVLVLSTFGKLPNENVAIPVSAMLIGTNGTRAYLNAKPDFDGRGTIKIRGSSSTQFPKKSFAFEIQDELGLDRKVSLLGLPKESDWVLYAPYTDKTLMRDFLAYELSNDIGTYAPRTRFIEVYVDQNGSKLTAADYQGVYVLIEKIKRSDKRVDIAELQPSQVTSPEVTGGYIFKKDRLDPGDVGFSTARAGSFCYVEPKEQEIVSAQKSYLANYIKQFETVLYSATFTNRAYTNFYDVAAGIDHHLMVEATKNIDGFRLSTFAHKDRLGKIAMGPIWDYNLTLGNADYLDGYIPTGWYYLNLGDGDYPWYAQLFRDVDFNQQYIDRWAEIRRGPFATTNILPRVIQIATALAEPAAHNYQKWKILGLYVWPNAPGYALRKTYRSEVDWMTNYIYKRWDWIDKQFPFIPTISGTLTEPRLQRFTITIVTNPLPVYYTTDGSDPRLSRGGISPKATQYLQPFTVDGNARIVARSKNGTKWSAPAAQSFVAKTPLVVITEMNFWNEFIELKNVGDDPVDLNGFRVRGGIEFTFTNSLILQPGAFAVITRDPTAFGQIYGGVANVVGPFNGHLANEGEEIILEGSMREPILDFKYDDTWYPSVDALPFSLVIRDDKAPLDTWGLKESWRPSSAQGGSPGRDDPPVNIPPVVVNEVLLAPDGLSVAAVELYNPSDAPAEVGNWVLIDDFFKDDGHIFHISAPRVIQPKGYTVITKDDHDASGNEPFYLTTEHESVHLFAANASGYTGYADGLFYNAAAGSLDYARYVSSDGIAHYFLQKPPTLGAANSQPTVGPVAINEIRYSPASFEAEFVELKNITSQDLKLYDPDRPTNTWRLNGLSFNFPPNVTIPANGFILLIQNDPARFRATNNVPDSVQIFTFDGHLQGNGENLQLLSPLAPITLFGQSEKIPMIVVDEVRYDDHAPWPTPIPGASIERNYSARPGSDPANWRGAIGATPGIENRAEEAWQSWQQQIFSAAELTDPTVSDANADPDHDGFSNAAEFAAGTDPKNPASALAIAATVSTTPTLSFDATPDRTYTVYFRPAADSGVWTPIATYRAASTTRTVQLTPAQPGYYKVSVP